MTNGDDGKYAWVLIALLLALSFFAFGLDSAARDRETPAPFVASRGAAKVTWAALCGPPLHACPHAMTKGD